MDSVVSPDRQNDPYFHKNEFETLNWLLIKDRFKLFSDILLNNAPFI